MLIPLVAQGALYCNISNVLTVRCQCKPRATNEPSVKAAKGVGGQSERLLLPRCAAVCSGCGAGCRLISLVQLKAYRSNRQSAARHGNSGEWQVEDGGCAR